MPPSMIPGPSAAAANETQNTRKRTGSELLDDGRGAKKVKVESERSSLSSKLKTKAERDKKKRKKKKRTRRLSVVAVEVERSMSKPRSTTTQPASIPQASSSSLKLAAEPEEQIESSVDKGKGKATSPEPGPSRAASPSIQPEASTSTVDYAREIARLKEKMAAQAELIQRHETYLNASQQSLTCQICLDLLYRPYALAPCGHITCYGCLVRWFTTPANITENHLQGLPIEGLLSSTLARNGAYLRRKKNCPVCRGTVVERPAELWDIKSMVQALVRSRLVEIPATVEEPAPAAMPAAGASNATANVNTDPWRNIFPVRPARAGGVLDRFGFDLFLPQHMGVHDAEDGGIYRCIDCHNEIVDGACSGCGREYAGHIDGGDTEHSSDEDDGWHGNARLRALLEEGEDEDDLDDEDDPGYPVFVPQGFWGGGAPVFHLPDGDDLTDEGDNDDDDAHYGHIFEVATDIATEVDEDEGDNDDEDSQYGGSFIDDDELVEMIGNDRRRGSDDSDEEVEFVDLLDGPIHTNRRRPSFIASDDEAETEAEATGEEDEWPPQPRPVYRRRRPVAVDGTDEDDEEE